MTTLAEVFDALKYRIDVDRHGRRRYYNDAGLLHREDGPAVEYPSGTVEWCQNGVLHREGGPAVIGSNGRHFEWFQNGVLHRTDGPAVEYADGNKEWWINGVEYTEAEYQAQLKALEQTS